FYCCSWYPPPVPTRRSSDLVVELVDGLGLRREGGVGRDHPQAAGVDAHGWGVCRERPSAGKAAGTAFRTCPRRLGHLSLGRCFPDRKSTRLNSSHVKISYAV